MATGEYNGIRITKGADFSQTFRYCDDAGVPANINGFSGRSQIRPYPDSPIAYDFTFTVEPQVVNNYGWFTISMSRELTATIDTGEALTLDPTPMSWDLDLIDSLGKVATTLRGIPLIYPQVTKP